MNVVPTAGRDDLPLPLTLPTDCLGLLHHAWPHLGTAADTDTATVAAAADAAAVTVAKAAAVREAI